MGGDKKLAIEARSYYSSFLYRTNYFIQHLKITTYYIAYVSIVGIF